MHKYLFVQSVSPPSKIQVTTPEVVDNVAAAGAMVGEIKIMIRTHTGGPIGGVGGGGSGSAES